MEGLDLNEEQIAALNAFVQATQKKDEILEGSTLDEAFGKARDYYLKDFITHTSNVCGSKEEVQADRDRWFFAQGHYANIREQERDLSLQEVMSYIESQEFLKEVNEWLHTHDDKGKRIDGGIDIKLESNGKARLSFICTPETRCAAWPDRCEDCGGDLKTGKCSIVVNLEKLIENGNIVEH